MKNIEIKLKLDYKELFKKITCCVTRKSSLILFGIGFIFLGYCAFVWYQNVYSYAWDEVKKQEYINTKNAGTVLNRAKFEKTLADIERRKEEYQQNMENMKDIFRLGSGVK